MIYIYPKLSKYDLGIIRLGGAGLGNLLFTYSRALIFSKENGVKLIWPTWPSLKLGPWIRREKDKRIYRDLFANNLHYISGIKKIFVLIMYKKISIEEYTTSKPKMKNMVIIYNNYKTIFCDLYKYYDIINANIYSILNKKNSKIIEKVNSNNSIAVHIRLGDFKMTQLKDLTRPIHNNRVPIYWYKNIVVALLNSIPRIKNVYVFSDGEDSELQGILSIDKVSRISFGNSINDIIAMSKMKLIIASNSTFSKWAILLGQTNSIIFDSMQQEKLIFDSNDKFQIYLGIEENLSTENIIKLKDIFN